MTVEIKKKFDKKKTEEILRSCEENKTDPFKGVFREIKMER